MLGINLEDKGSGMSNEQRHAAVNKRRQFIKKASAGVAVSSLPMQSVWGACTVSGVQSGNLSQNGGKANQCSMPALSGGRSPGYWFQGNTFTVGHNSKSIKDVFLSLGNNPTQVEKDHYRKQVLSVRGCINDPSNPGLSYAGLTMGLDSVGVEQLTNGLASSLTPYAGFLTQSNYSNVFFHVAAAYMNTYFKLYSGSLGGKTEADAVANAVMINYLAGTTTLSDAEMGYTNGSTMMSL